MNQSDNKCPDLNSLLQEPQCDILPLATRATSPPTLQRAAEQSYFWWGLQSTEAAQHTFTPSRPGSILGIWFHWCCWDLLTALLRTMDRGLITPNRTHLVLRSGKLEIQESYCVGAIIFVIMGDSRIDLFIFKKSYKITRKFPPRAYFSLTIWRIGKGGGEKKSSIMRHRVSKAFLSEVLGYLKQIPSFFDRG